MRKERWKKRYGVRHCGKAAAPRRDREFQHRDNDYWRTKSYAQLFPRWKGITGHNGEISSLLLFPYKRLFHQEYYSVVYKSSIPQPGILRLIEWLNGHSIPFGKRSSSVITMKANVYSPRKEKYTSEWALSARPYWYALHIEDQFSIKSISQKCTFFLWTKFSKNMASNF